MIKNLMSAENNFIPISATRFPAQFATLLTLASGAAAPIAIASYAPLPRIHFKQQLYSVFRSRSVYLVRCDVAEEQNISIQVNELAPGMLK